MGKKTLLSRLKTNRDNYHLILAAIFLFSREENRFQLKNEFIDMDMINNNTSIQSVWGWHTSSRCLCEKRSDEAISSILFLKFSEIKICQSTDKIMLLFQNFR